MSKKINTTDKTVGILYDSVSLNTGDIAIGVALIQVLEKRGIKARILDPYTYKNDPSRTVIVGGGQLLRDPGDDFYDKFRIKGKHILNSVGVSGTKDFSYLKDYLYVSTRSTFESNVIKGYVGKGVDVIPCTTTLLESKKYTIPGLKSKPGEKVVGIQLVPDVLITCPDIIQIINNIPHKKVFIPFTHYNQDASFMKNLPFDKTNAIMLDKLEPLELHSAMSQMDYVIVSSLHASIFAYTQNVPFISMYQKKAHDYFKDRKLDNFVYTNQEQLVGLIDLVENSNIDMSEKIEKDRAMVNKTIDKYVEIINSTSTTAQYEEGSDDIKASALRRLQLEVKQLEGVVGKRDVLMNNMIYENMRSSEKKLNTLRDYISELENKLVIEQKKRLLSRMKRIAYMIVGKKYE